MNGLMTPVQLIHNPRCRKSREALELLQGAGFQPEVRLYLEDPFNARELTTLISKLGISPAELVRREEEVYKQIYKGKELSDREWIDAMVAHPKLIQRPIVMVGDRAVVGRPPELVLTLLKAGA